MDKLKAEQDIRLIREIMERSVKYTHFTGLSGVLSGIAALVGTYATYWIYMHVPLAEQNKWSLITWLLVFVFAIGEDFTLAQRTAKKAGATILTPATYHVLQAVFPGVFIAFVISLVALVDGAPDAIPGVLALGYGAALCSAGMFSQKEVWVYGLVQLITGTIALFFMSKVPYSLYALALEFGVYQILFGIWIAAKYRR